jgi:heptosyltransferase II
MKVLIELPSWLGDTIMTTPAIENLVRHLNDIEITLIGSFISTEALKNHPKVMQVFVLNKKIIDYQNLLKNFGEFDIFFSFRSSYRSKLIKTLVKAEVKYQYNKKRSNGSHQVEKYNNFINSSLNINSIPGKLKLYSEKKVNSGGKKLLGINPGASYGSAKRWYPKEFASVAIDLSSDYDMILFGGPEEKEITKDIENYLTDNDISNYQNLAGMTTLNELMTNIASLDLLITGDSGPMHIAAAFQVPTVTIFGPTKDKETCQWMNEKSIIVKKNLDCQPCMRRSCPLKHHNCMKLLNAKEVLQAVKKL